MNAQRFRELASQIGWNQHGGSGFSFTRADMLAMSADDLRFHAQDAVRRRKEEADQIREAHKSGGKRTNTIGPPAGAYD